MAILCSLELIAGEKLTIKNKTTAHSCSNEKTYNILVALGSTEFILTQDADIYIVADIEGATEFVLNGLSDVVISPGKIGREKNYACLLVDNAGRTGSYSVNIALLNTGGVDKLFYDVDDNFFNIL